MAPRRASRGAREAPPPPGALAVEAVEVDGEVLVVFGVEREAEAPPSLTPAERAVSLLTIRGLTTAAIARARGVSRATVSSQLQSIYRKLQVCSRAELAAALDRA